LPTFGSPTIPTFMEEVYQTVASLRDGGRACDRIVLRESMG
jgi:hypothetical protein